MKIIYVPDVAIINVKSFEMHYGANGIIAFFVVDLFIRIIAREQNERDRRICYARFCREINVSSKCVSKGMFRLYSRVNLHTQGCISGDYADRSGPLSQKFHWTVMQFAFEIFVEFQFSFMISRHPQRHNWLVSSANC